MKHHNMCTDVYNMCNSQINKTIFTCQSVLTSLDVLFRENSLPLFCFAEKIVLPVVAVAASFFYASIAIAFYSDLL